MPEPALTNDPTLPPEHVAGQHTDAIRLYHLGRWGAKGYAVPWATRDFTNNKTIAYLCEVVGHNLFSAMHMPDAMVTSPPRLPVLIHVHKSIVRARQIITTRMTPDHELPTRPIHATPAQIPFMVCPTPYWNVRNYWMRSWCGMILESLAEAMQHSDNIFGTEIGEHFSSTVLQNARLVYNQLATEFFGKTREAVQAPGFVLTDADFKTYDPDIWFTATERVDSRAPLDWNETEDDLQVLAQGLPYEHVRPFLKLYTRDPSQSAASTGVPRPGGQPNVGEWPQPAQP